MPRRYRPRRKGAKANRKPDAVGEYFGDAWSLAKRTASGLNEIRKLINVEEKDLETVQASAGFDTTGTVYSLSTIAQGTDFNTHLLHWGIDSYGISYAVD